MIGFFLDIANLDGSRWAVWVLASLLESAVLLAVVGLLWLAIRSRVAPQVGYLLFLLVPLKLLIPIGVAAPPAIARWAPTTLAATWVGTAPARGEVSLPSTDRGTAPEQSTPASMTEEIQSATRPELSQAREPVDPVSPIEARGRAGNDATEEPLRASTAVHSAEIASRPSASGLILIAWLTIVVSLAVRWGIVQWRFGRMVRRLAAFDGARYGLDLPELCRSAGIRGEVFFAECDALAVPAVWGILRPTIIVPREVSSTFTSRQLHWLLLHELAHVARHDLLVSLIQRVALILNFFNPAVWIANRVVDRLREFACDDLASSLCETSAVETGEVFVQIIRRAVRPALPLGATLGLFGFKSRSACLERVERLLDSDRPRRLKVSRVGQASLLLLAALSLPYVRAASEEPASEKKPAKADSPTKTSSPAKDDAPQAANPAESDAAVSGSFDLRVVGPEGKPVPNAKVELRSSSFAGAEQVTVGTYDRPGQYGHYMTTDDEGRLVFGVTPAAAHFNLFVKQPGFAPYCAKWDGASRTEPTPARFTAQLEAGWVVGGIVVDADGKPVEGVEIHPSIEFTRRPGDNRQLATGERAKTDAAGRWRFDAVPLSKMQVSVEINHPEFKPLRKALKREEFGIERDGEAGASITLDRGLTVTGTITDNSGKPVSGALVRTKFVNSIRETTSRDDGTYRLGGCEPAHARIVVSAQGRATDMKDVEISADLQPVDFEMQPGGRVRIRVVDRDGQPVPKARIFFQRWRGDSFSYFEFRHVNQYADDNGVWEWNEAPVDEFKADICPPNGMTLNSQPIVARDEEYVFKTSPPLVITGRVVDAETQRPIERFQVLPGVRWENSRLHWSENERFQGTEGQFTLRHTYGELAHLVRVEAEGYLPAMSRDIKSDEADVAVDFELKKGKDVLGRVVSPALKAADGAKVVLGIAGSQISIRNGDIELTQTYARKETTDKTGKFRFPPQDKDFQLIITHPSGFAYIKSTTDWPKLKIIRLEPWARVEGTFRVGSKAAPNVDLTINTHNPQSHGTDVPHIFTQHHGRTGADGEFAFERVFSGKASIGRYMVFMADSGATEVTSASMVPMEFPGGETTRIELGGTGRPVVGQLLPADGFEREVPWKFASVDVRIDASDEDNNDMTLYMYASVDKNGAFRIDDVPSGKYLLSVRFNKPGGGHVIGHQFVVPILKEKQSDEAFDLGELKLQK